MTHKRHEWIVTWDGAQCKHYDECPGSEEGGILTVPASLSTEEVERRLNDYERLKKATDYLSAEDAEWAADELQDATNLHGMSQSYGGNNYYLTDAIRDYSKIIRDEE